MNNVTFSLGGIQRYRRKYEKFYPNVNNKLTHSVSTHQILETYPIEAMKKERTLYRYQQF